MGFVGFLLWIYDTFKPDATVRTLARAAARASHMLNRTTLLVNFAYGTKSMHNHGTESMPCNGEEHDGTSLIYNYWAKQEEYIDEETEALNEKGRGDLSELYKNNQKFRDEIINFVGDKAELSNEKILDERYKHNTLYKLGMETLAEFIFSKDYTRSLIEILANYK